MARTHHHYRSVAEGLPKSNWHSRWTCPHRVKKDRQRDQNKTRFLWKRELKARTLQEWEDGVVIRFGRPNFPGHVH